MKALPTLAALASLLLPATVAAADWPQFRGPGGNAVAEGQSIPVEFGPAKNLRWKTALPVGQSSPCISGDRIFLTAHDGPTLKMLCLGRANGKLLWERTRQIAKVPSYEHVAGDPANSTPATDGQRVIFQFDDYGVVATDLEGAELWEKKFPPTGNDYSYGASPVLDDGKLYLNRDGGLESSFVCLDAATGAVKWRTERTNAIVSFCTPYVWRDGGAKQVLVGGSGRIEAYDAGSGAAVWKVTGLPFFVCPSPVGGNGMIYFGGWTTAHVTGRSRIESGFGEEVGLTAKELEDPAALMARFDGNKDGWLQVNELPPSRARDAFNFLDRDKNGKLETGEVAILYGKEPIAPGRNVVVAIAAGGQGDITQTHVKWEALKGLPYVSSPLLHRGRLYLMKTGGFVTCLDAVTGKAHYESERLGVAGEYYATPVAVGEHIVICAHRGTAFVIRAGDKLEILARNELGEALSATPAVVDNTLYLRGEKHLWVFGR